MSVLLLALVACGEDDTAPAAGSAGAGGLLVGGSAGAAGAIAGAAGAPGSAGSAESAGEGGAAGSNAAGSGGDPGEPFRVSLSVSPFSETLFKAGVRFSDGQQTAKNPKELQQLYIAHGATEVYSRLSSEDQPTGSPDDHSLAATIERAKIAKQLGLPLNPELGLWAHYGDITCQPPPNFAAYPSITLPGPWETLSLEQMETAFRGYGELVAKVITETGVTVNVWDIGNEVDLGFAGLAVEGVNCSTPYVAPDGVDPEIGKRSVFGLLQMSEASRIEWLTAHLWPHEARLLGAVAEGIRKVVPGARVSTHISQTLSATYVTSFFQAMDQGGFHADVLGLSFYPSASPLGNKVQRFRETVESLRTKLKRPVFLAEYAYPAGATPTGPYKDWTNALPAYPMSEDGQAELLRDLASWGVVSGVSGIRPWAPEVFVSDWQGFALFAGTQEPVLARKGLDSIQEGLAKPDAAAFHDP